MSYSYPITTADRLLIRLLHAVKSGQKVTFLLGSGLTSPSKTERGVPNANEMVERVRKCFTQAAELEAFDISQAKCPEGNKYQSAMQFMIECRGQSALNKLIRDAVLETRNNPSGAGLTEEELERDLHGWFLRPGVSALGLLLKEYEMVFRRPILTSNFDPLIEIGIRRSGRGAITINLPNDGSFRGLIVNDNSVQVVHFHGYWGQGDTLHTPDQLTRERPLLAGSLKRLLQETVLVVMGYGGWKDVFTDSLLKAIAEQSETLDVLWTFFPNNPTEILQSYQHLFASFQSLPGQRVVAYCGVDCHQFLPQLRNALAEELRKPTIAEVAFGSELSKRLTLLQQSNGILSPPTIDTWVGRQAELHSMLNSNSSVLSLHGLGGFGKSTLAARYLDERERRKDFALWYWADCREQGNTIQTHIVNILERITQGEITAASLKSENTQDVIELFFQRLGNFRGLFVFDNIDHYVDLETQQAVGTMHLLFERALNTKHQSQFVFTSRPRLSYECDRFHGICLPGLQVNDIEELFRIRGANWDPIRKAEQIAKLQKITEGSALHLNLIATQVAKQRTTLDEILIRIDRGTAPEVEDRIFYEIWGTLKEEHQAVLRHLAELPHAQPENMIGSCVGDVMNYNRFTKAMKALKSLNLVVIKAGEPLSPMVELHPLVRSWIRRQFNKEAQQPIVRRILSFFDLIIGRFRYSTASGPVYVIETWTSKIEVCLENGLPTQALETLYDIYQQLKFRGYTEEFLRLGELVLRQYHLSDDPSEVQKFDAITDSFLDSLGEMGRHEEVDLWITRLSDTVEGKSARYIWLCNIRAYAAWLRNDYKSALKWAGEGDKLKSDSNLDTVYDCKHNLALALRDSGDVGPALKHFLLGENLENILAPDHVDKRRRGDYYGNIGRCLQLQEQFDDALICLKKSARLLDEEKMDTTHLNRGFAAQWLGEVLNKKGDYNIAYIALRTAAAKWKTISPERARKATEQAEVLEKKITDKTLSATGDWECEEMYRTWLTRGRI